MTTLPLFSSGPLSDAPAPELRPYQASAIEAIRAHIRAGRRRIIVQMPTAAGKNVLTAALIRSASAAALFVAHRRELLDQCVDQLAKVGISRVGVLRGDDDRTDPGAPTQVASIQTLARRDKPKAGIVFIDECHRAASEQYLEHIFQSYPDAIIIGLTATPTRLDGKPLGGELFQAIVCAATYSDLLKRPDWLVAPDCYSAPIEPDLSGVRVVRGEFEENALGAVMGSTVLVGQIVSHWLKLAGRHPKWQTVSKQDARGRVTSKLVRMPGYVEAEPGGSSAEPGGPDDPTLARRRTFVFATSIAHSRAIVAEFQAAGVTRVAHLDGETPERERSAMIRAIRAGELEVISNCNILLEGVDAPEVKCVVHARPTMSLVLWMQSCGRIMRPWCPICRRPCKEHPGVTPLLLDHAGNYDRHGPPHEDRLWTLTDRPARPNVTKNKICKSCFAYVDPGRATCPHCGVEFPAAPAREIPKETSAELVMRDGADVRQAFYDDQVEKARRRGFKPGYPAAKYKEKFGAWPPWAWSEATRSSFASDLAWQEQLSRHETARELYGKKREGEAVAEGAAAAEEPEGEEGFADWYEKQ